MTLAKKKTSTTEFMSNVINLPEDLKVLLQQFMIILSLLNHIQP